MHPPLTRCSAAPAPPSRSAPCLRPSRTWCPRQQLRRSPRRSRRHRRGAAPAAAGRCRNSSRALRGAAAAPMTRTAPPMTTRCTRLTPSGSSEWQRPHGRASSSPEQLGDLQLAWLQPALFQTSHPAPDSAPSSPHPLAPLQLLQVSGLEPSRRPGARLATACAAAAAVAAAACLLGFAQRSAACSCSWHWKACVAAAC